jgi:transcription antitermination factor NusG
MQKNWYAVYTRPNCETKVAHFFFRKKIEHFCPMNSIKIQSFRKVKILHEPLFKSHVFVNIAEEEICWLKRVDGVISLLHWKSKPLIIRENEITAIKEFTIRHQSIELQKTQIITSDMAGIEEIPNYSIDGKIFDLINEKLKVNLPSIGYVMIARMEEKGNFTKDATILQHNPISYF